MANTPSKAVLVAGAVMAIGAMVMLNSMSQKMTPKSEEEQEQEQARQAQQSAPAATAPKPIPVPPRGVKGDETGKASALVGLDANKAVGGVSASGPEVNIRYSWTPAVQSDPKKVYDAVAVVKKAMPNANVHVINTDEQPGAPTGVFVGGKQVTPAAADGSIAVDPAVIKAAAGSQAKK